jgi:hypothetical protein
MHISNTHTHTHTHPPSLQCLGFPSGAVMKHSKVTQGSGLRCGGGGGRHNRKGKVLGKASLSCNVGTPGDNRK